MPVPSAASGREVEWQLDALDLRSVERWVAARFPGDATAAGGGGPASAAGGGPASAAAGDWPEGLEVVGRPGKRLADSYVDTEDWRIARAGYVLRLRRRGQQLEATVKDLAPATDGLRNRLEVTEVVGEAGIGDLDPAGPVGRRVRALVGRRPLGEVLEVRTRRRLFDLSVHGQAVGELALDDTTIVVPGDLHRVQLKRVELEVDEAWVAALQPLIEQLRRDCGLQPATLSKFEAGLLAAGVGLPGRVGPSPPAPGADASLGEVAVASLRRDLAAMVRYEPGTRLGEDPEALHQMRVATRRLRAALALFVGALPARAARLGDELGWLAGVLGAVRDVDVQLEDLDDWCEALPGDQGHALDQLRGLLVAHREDARAQLLEALDSRRYDRLLDGLRVLVDQAPSRRPAPAAVPALLALPDLVAQRHRAAVRAARRARASGIPTDYHRLRIRAKRLRYAVDFTAGLYGGSARRFARTLGRLQDELGRAQDASVAYDRLRALATGPEATGLDAGTVFAMGMAAQRCRELAAQRLAAVGKPTAVLGGDEWRRLARAMAEAATTTADRLARQAVAGPRAAPSPPAAAARPLARRPARRPAPTARVGTPAGADAAPAGPDVAGAGGGPPVDLPVLVTGASGASANGAGTDDGPAVGP